MKLKFLGKALKNSIIAIGCYSAYECYRQGFNSEEIYYFLNGFYRGMHSIGIGAIVVFNYKLNGANEETHEYASKILYKLFKKNSGSYIKLGQSLAQSEHVLPDPYIRNMEPLCQEAPCSSFETIKDTIEKELNDKFENIFSEFDPKPLGSASIAQVHKAKLKNNGEIVAVKIQHRNISIQCPSDVQIVRFATWIAELLWPGVSLRWIYTEFKKNILNEINFFHEADNAEKIKRLFADDPRVVIPKVYRQYSTKKLLFLSFEDGKSIVDIEHRKKHKIDVNEIANLMSQIFYRQIFDFGFVHSDPHQGNLFIRKELVNGKLLTRLVLLDHGLYRELDKDFIYNYSLIWRGIITQNADSIKRGCVGLGVDKHELFVAVISNKRYQDVMKKELKYETKQRLNPKNISTEQQMEISKFIHSNLYDLTSVLSNMRSEMILVLKINGFLRSIDKRIGNPLNNINIMMSYIYNVINREIRHRSDESKAILFLEFYKFKLFSLLYGMYFSFYKWWYSADNNDVDLDVGF